MYRDDGHEFHPIHVTVDLLALFEEGDGLGGSVIVAGRLGL